MKKPLVSIIIVNWDGKHLLKKLLPSLKKIDYKKTEIIVVDNGSTDGSVEYLQKFYSVVKIIKNKMNLGFALANNQGIKKSTGELILFLNNDTIVTKNFLSVLVDRILSDDKMGACQPKILSLEKKGKLDSIGSFLTRTGFHYHLGFEAKNRKKLDKELKLFSGKGSCLIFKKKVLNKIGYFDDDYFAYFEETDLCWRLWLAGYYLLYIPEIAIYHKSWATARKLPIEFINYHSFKNRIASLIKNLDAYNLVLILPLHLVICTLLCIYYLLRNKTVITVAILKAFFWNISNLDKTLKKRTRIQNNLRKVDDGQLFLDIMRNPGIAYYLFILKNSIVRSKLFSK